MASKVKLSTDLYDGMMAGKWSGPDAMEAEQLRRANVRIDRKVIRMQDDISGLKIQRVTNEGELERLLGPKNEDAPAATE